ncbi:MAG: ATP-binding protein [Deltaproteobacteria bacterium]|nr:ATP-binding protein [Deltaproteobacteria bacterium]
MIERKLKGILEKAARQYPAVTLFGPRQAGKTTLVRAVFAGHAYVNLEDPTELELAKLDVRRFFTLHPAPVIIDEVQRYPELISSVQVMIDEKRDAMGQFILTGSHQPLLAASVSQSLAGRTSVLTLLPFSIDECGGDESTDAMILKGFMPDVRARGIDPGDYYRNYFKTYVERDLRQLINVRNVILFERFITLLAGRIGQVVNMTSLANETGVSSQTIGEWISILEASFLVFRLTPYFSNISKRLVKSPKIYFTDVGLAAYLLGLENAAQVARDPLRGQLFENLVIADVLKQVLNSGKEPRLSFLRTGKGFEIDLLMREGMASRPVEIKSAMTYRPSLAANLRAYSRAEANSVRPTLVYDGESHPDVEGDAVKVVNFRDFSVKA